MCVCVCVCVCFQDIFRVCCHYTLYPIYIGKSCKTMLYMTSSVDTPRKCLSTLAETYRNVFLLLMCAVCWL